MASILALPTQCQSSVAAGLSLSDCIRFSAAVGKSATFDSTSAIAPGLLPFVQTAKLPEGQQPSPAVCMELVSGLRSLELEDVQNLDPHRLTMLTQLEELKVRRRQLLAASAADLHNVVATSLLGA